MENNLTSIDIHTEEEKEKLRCSKDGHGRNPSSNLSSPSEGACLPTTMLREMLEDFHIDPLICLIDMDCFYVQVELRREPEYRGLPTGVVQYKKDYRGGGLIAVSYEARARGVKRGSRASEALEKCPEIHIFAVPELHGKADLTRYRDAGAETIKVMMEKFKKVERASVDEAFLDLTEEVALLFPRYVRGELCLAVEELGATCVPGAASLDRWFDQTTLARETALTEKDLKLHLNHLALAIAAKLINELRESILRQTEFHCSAGISFSKTLAKLACGMNKPRKQTILPINCVSFIYEKTRISDVRFLGGKLGDEIMHRFGITTMAELSKIDRQSLFLFFDYKTIEWIRNICTGKDNESVQPRQCPKSIGCSKNFMGASALKYREEVKHWMTQFALELEQRLKKDQLENNRTATLMTIHLTWNEHKERKSISRCTNLVSYEKEDIAREAFELADRSLTAMGYRNDTYDKRLISMGVVASKIVKGQAFKSANRIENYFQQGSTKKDILGEENVETQQESCATPPMFEDVEADSDSNGSSQYATISCGQTDMKRQPGPDPLNCEPSTSRGHPGSSSYVPYQPSPVSSCVQEAEDAELVELLQQIAKHETATREERRKDRMDGQRKMLLTDNEKKKEWENYDCPKCGKPIFCQLYEQQHNDYHLAKELEKELQQEYRDARGPKRKLTVDDSPTIPTKVTKKNTTEPKSKATGPIDKYFKKLNS